MYKKSDSTSQNNYSEAVPPKKLRKRVILWDNFENDNSDSPRLLSETEREIIEQYLSLPRVRHAEDSLKFWLAQATYFPLLSPLVKNF